MYETDNQRINMPEETNRVFEIVEYPEGETPDRECFELREEPIPELTEDGQVLVRTLYLRMDPGSRSKMVVASQSPLDFASGSLDCEVTAHGCFG
jgi:NADPH-dependent curcumin reductase CurA